ncbi:RluA family pseudouridine synthase [Brumimicrobium aurantiacum]|uniref:RluA family pseudouridine synthase n=1 Tax=Brumimicrobium aurantiacum TaxID=1737063 RepID=A0A3E1EVZ1_9FLAO|nr:RluA family pseudouridine synthase [Brumimicrobium aurantiacum]RFC53725.1 RluA family pseudouridine synthase [Brumimicrobium aurantiacum]
MKTTDFNHRVQIEKLIVEDHPTKVRIYDYLVGKLTTISSRKGIKKALSRNQVYLNGDLAKSGDFVRQGDAIVICENEIVQHKDFDIELNVVYEDDELAVVEKPSGIPVSGNTFKTLQNALPQHLKLSQAFDYLPAPLPVHRLDLLTHGLVVVAKTHSTRINLGKQFEKREVSKKYHAIVQGRLQGKGSLNTSIEGKQAKTYFHSLGVYPSVKNKWISLIELSPVSGRKHQLRIHLSRLGFPIIGDQRYGEKGNTLKHKGLFLAAVGIQFQHPKSGEIIDLNIPAPNKFQRFLEREEKWVQRILERKKEV